MRNFMHIFEDNLTGGVYKGILQNVLVPAARALHPHGCILQKDNLSAHNTKDVYDYLESRDARVIEEELPWPSYSLDLKPHGKSLGSPEE